MPIPAFLRAAASLLLLFFCTVAARPASAELLDRVVAVVNDDVVTLSELNREGKNTFRSIMEKAAPAEAENAILKARQEILSKMIDNLLVKQRAAQADLSVSDEEVNAAIERVLERNKATRKDFQRELAAMDMSEEEYRSDIRDQILQSKLISYEIRSKIVITDKKIQEYYEAQYRNQISNGNYHILQFGLTWEEGNDKAKETARQRVGEIHGKARAGEDFRELARRHSTLPSAEDGGDIGVFTAQELAGDMKDTIPTMKPGEISPVIETPSGFQFFMLLSNRGDASKQVSLEKVSAEIRELLYQQEMEKQFNKWVSQLREEAYIKILL